MQDAPMVVGHRAASDATVSSLPFESFYADHRDRLVRLLALDLRDVHVAAEAVDVAMSRAWERWDRLDRQHDAAAWTYRVARNWATSRWRRHRRLRPGSVPDTGRADSYPAEHAHVLAAVAALDADLRAVVVLRHLGGLTTEETATALGVPPGTVKSRLSRARDLLRTVLEDDR